MNYYDDEIREPFHNQTIGIVICKKKNDEIVKHNKNDNIVVSTYQIS